MAELAAGTALYLDLLKKSLTGSLYDESAWQWLESKPVGGARGLVRGALIKLFRMKSVILLKATPFDRHKRETGEDWPLVGFTMVGHRRLDNIRDCIARVIADDIPGDFVECGVWRGGSAIFAKAVLNAYGAADRKIWLADSFEGMPVLKDKGDLAHEKTDPDLSWFRYLAVSREDVENNFRRFDLFDDGVKFIKGWFSETLPTAPIEQIAILRLDGDHYSSTMDALNALYHKVSKGGFVIIDDYVAYAGCKAAVTEFRAKRGITSELTKIDEWAVYWRI
jgi:O-methyltransferase